jgi:PAT family beta-lactamase induction signal transducer AmpG
VAATTFAVLTAASNVPVTYMTVVDRRAYSLGGVTGTLAVDALISVARCVLDGDSAFEVRSQTIQARSRKREPCHRSAAVRLGFKSRKGKVCS